MQGTNTIFSCDHNKAAQLFAGTKTNTPPVAPTWAAAMVIDPTAALYQQITQAGATALTATNFGKFGQLLVLELASDGTGRTATFGSGFRVNGTVVGTANKSIIVGLFSNGVDSWIEAFRSGAAV